MKTLTFLFGALSLCATLAPGCRAVGGVVGNEYADPQSKLVWIARPEMDVPSADEPTVYLRYKDAVSSGLDLQPQVRQAIQDAGYVLTKSKDADYQFVVTVRHFDKAKSFDGGDGAMRVVEAAAPIAGAVAGYALSGDSAGSKVAGTVGGGIIGFAAGSAMRNFSKVYEWDLILDLEVFENVGEYEETRKRDSGSDSASRAGVAVGAISETGSRTESQTRSAEITKTRSHLNNTFRLVAVAYQMRMSRDEALDVLLPRLPSAVSSVLP